MRRGCQPTPARASALRRRPRCAEAFLVLEAALFVACLIALGATAMLLAIAPATLLVAGFWLTLAGLAFGVPTGLLYHVELRRSLLARDRLPPRWWLRPTSLHGEIRETDRARVLGWCYAGAAGFLVSMAGCVLAALAAVRGI